MREVALYRDIGAEVLRNGELLDFGPSKEIREMVAVDGSYSFLFNVSSMWLAVVRVGGLAYVFKDGGYRLMESSNLEMPVLVSTEKSVVQRQSDLHRQLFEATRLSGDHPRAMMNEFRHYLEGELILRMAAKRTDAIIAVDGTLASFHKESNHLHETREVCEERGNILVGISKDSYSHAFGGVRTDEELLNGRNGMAYVRVPSRFEDKHKGFLHGDVYFAKLHPDSPKWFRIDVGTFRDDPSFVFSNLAHYARSGLCPGYPYPLLEAHRFAVTVRQFREIYEEVLLQVGAEQGLEIEDIIGGLTHVEGERRGAFHEYIDQASRDIR
ncbi:MAG: DNA double-strand break repair nuclease NurA [Thermoplasmata archaeon]